MVKYLDYLAETVQVVVNDNKNLREISEKLISHNDYLVENLEKSINYQEYLAENLDKSIAYGEYIAENLDKTIAFGDYLAENLDKSIAYGEYIAESLDKTIAYGEYIAESVDNTIAYSEYLAEHVEGNIAYSEYIAEHLDDNIAYSEYIAENLDKNISYSGLIVEKLNGSKLNEDVSSLIPTLEEWGFDTEEDLIEIPVDTIEEEEATIAEDGIETPAEEAPVETEEGTEVSTETEVGSIEDVLGAIETTIDFVETTIDEPTLETPVEAPVAEVEVPVFFGESETELSLQIDNLISEAKKRKVADKNDIHFLKFLGKSQVDSFYQLTNEEQELVKLHMNEKSYFNGNDVLRLIQEALSVKNESLENRIIRLMPDTIKPVWENLNEIAKKSVLSQARLGYDLTNEAAIENFWYTRNLTKKESTKKLVSHDSLIQEDTLSENEINLIMERIKGLK